MRFDYDKFKAAVKDTIALQRREEAGVKEATLALYATYLYCVISQKRGKLHMKWWNKEYPIPMDPVTSEISIWKWPYCFGVTFDTLDQQKAFIDQAHKYLSWAQDHTKKFTPNSEFIKLPLDFYTLKEETEEPTTVSGWMGTEPKTE